jgi:ABC-type amino acid transport substrate-binding protein
MMETSTMNSDRGVRALWGALAVIGVLSIYSVWHTFPSTSHEEIADNSAFVRVKASDEIRVGYFIEPPYLVKESATGQLSGIFYDVIEELGKRLGVRIVWVEEASLSTLSAGLDAGRYDMIAFPLWRSAGSRRRASRRS